MKNDNKLQANKLQAKAINKKALQGILDALVGRRLSLRQKRYASLYQLKQVADDLKNNKAEQAELNRLIGSLIAKRDKNQEDTFTIKNYDDNFIGCKDYTSEKDLKEKTQAAFRADLSALCAKHRAEFDIDIHGDAWADIEVDINEYCTINGEQSYQYQTINLGSIFSDKIP